MTTSGRNGTERNQMKCFRVYLKVVSAQCSNVQNPKSTKRSQAPTLTWNVLQQNKCPNERHIKSIQFIQDKECFGIFYENNNNNHDNYTSIALDRIVGLGPVWSPQKWEDGERGTWCLIWVYEGFQWEFPVIINKFV